MRQHLLLFCIFFAVLTVFVSCEKDSDFYQAESPELTDQTSWAAHAQDLLDQLPGEVRDLLTPEDVDAFKTGPSASQQRLAQRSSFRTSRKWYPVLAYYYMTSADSLVSGSGIWQGVGKATFEVPQFLDMTTGFVDGSAVMTDEVGQKMTGTLSAGAARQMPNGYVRQALRWALDIGTGYYFNPDGELPVNVLIRPGRKFPVMLLVRGWAYYGLNVDPVPKEFEEHFTEEFLEQHYTCLETTPGANPMYIETFNTFWIYPTVVPDVIAVPGIGEGTWHDVGPVTFIVDQTQVPPNPSVGQFRIYLSERENYKSAPYLDFCHVQEVQTMTGGSWPFDVKGGTEDFFNYTGFGTGVWVGLGPPNFGATPLPGTFPFDFADYGFNCNAYGSTECAGLCIPGGDGTMTQVFIIGCYYEQDRDNCFTISDAGTVQYDTAVTVTLPDGNVFIGGGAVPHEATFGPYTGMFSSATIKSEMTPTGLFNRVVHFFDDGAGNAFWTSSLIVGVPLSPTEFHLDQKIIIVGGTGDFENARGVLHIDAVLDLTTFMIDNEKTGEMCL